MGYPFELSDGKIVDLCRKRKSIWDYEMEYVHKRKRCENGGY